MSGGGLGQLESAPVFEHERFGRVRIMVREGRPWFAAADVATALGYANSSEAVQAHCKHVNLFRTDETSGLELNPDGEFFILESDVYRLALHSRLQTAEEFQDWVAGKVLPRIREAGNYGGAGEQRLIAMLEEVSRQLRVACEEASMAMAEAREMRFQLDAERERRRRVEAEYWKSRDVANFGRSMQVTGGLIQVNELGRMMYQVSGGRIGSRGIYEWLRKHGWLNRSGSQQNRCLPTQRAISEGLILIRTREGKYSYGRNSVTVRWPVAMITVKGQRFFMEKAVRMRGGFLI